MSRPRTRKRSRADRSARSTELGGENAPQVRPFEIARALVGLGLPRRIPPAVARLAGVVEEGRAWLTGRPPLLTRGTVEILTRDWPLGCERAVAELGYRITPLDVGIARLLEEIPGRSPGKVLKG